MGGRDLSIEKRLADFVASLPEPPRPKASGAASAFVRDADYEASSGVREALAAIGGGAGAVLVIGKAGTGKTTLVRYLREMPGGDRQVVVAPTAVAAMNAQAQTIHSFFRLPFGVLDARNLEQSYSFGALYRKMRRLVIDEISMVRADVVDAIDARLRHIREDDRPFGGVQVVLVGDFLQLPPVVQSQDREILHGLGYRSPYAFAAHVFERMGVVPVSLEKVHRQDEKEFIDLLNRVRTGDVSQQLVDVINGRCFGPHRAGREPLLMTSTKASADGYNRAGMAALPGPSVFLDAVVEGKLDIDRDRYPVPERLELRVGARVMTVKNDMSRRWINGSLGTVARVEGGGVVVAFDAGGEHRVDVASWEKVRQKWNADTGRIDAEVVGAYKQVPILPAWAITIHKAQGLTLDDARIDLGSGAFATGQLYVALSRVRTMAGLSLARGLKTTDLRADPMLKSFVEWAASSAG